MLEAVKNNGLSLDLASQRLKNNRNVVLNAVKQNGMALIYASEQLQSDKELLEVVEKDVVKSSLDWDDKKWYSSKMDVLANIREKELLEESITVSNIKAKKNKF